VVATFTIREAKAKLSSLIARARNGEEITISRRKKPVVQLVALPVARTGPRIPGAWKGKISWSDDAFNLLTDQELKD
jgi:prevent-host-death family protein